MKRFGMIIKLCEENVDEYISLHSNPQPELIEALEASNIKNNSVFLFNGLLFNYFEYHGNNFDADWQKYTQSPAVADLMVKMKGFFKPFGETFPKTGWTEMSEIFHKE